MGAYSELDMERQYVGVTPDDPFVEDDPFEADDEPSAKENRAEENRAEESQTVEAAEAPAPAQDVPPQSEAILVEQPKAEPAEADAKAGGAKEDEDAKRKAHEVAEAKRKAEWEARQRQKKDAEQQQLAALAAMSDEELLTASLKRVGDDTEKLTRRNMKECVAEHIQTLCLTDPAFARKVMHPRKGMIHCIWYINRKAKEFIEQELKDNDFPKENGIYGSDVPDGMCYQWAVDYFNDPNAKEDEEKEEAFVPKPYPGAAAGAAKRSKSAKRKAKGRDTQKKAEDTTKPKDAAKAKAEHEGQISLLGVA